MPRGGAHAAARHVCAVAGQSNVTQPYYPTCCRKLFLRKQTLCHMITNTSNCFSNHSPNLI